MASYPSAVKTFTTKNAGDVIQPSHIGDLQDEVSAIEDGLLNGSAPINSSRITAPASQITNSTCASLTVSGSTVNLAALPYILPTAGASTGTVLTVTSTSGSTMTLAWAAPVVGQVVLLGSTSGTSVATAAGDLATIAITGLTALDTIEGWVTFEVVTQALSADMLIRNTTDAVTLLDFTGFGTAGTSLMGRFSLRQFQSAATLIAAEKGGAAAAVSPVTVTTAWTGSWTLALRSQGIISGGTLKYSWSVFRVKGQ